MNVYSKWLHSPIIPGTSLCRSTNTGIGHHMDGFESDGSFYQNAILISNPKAGLSYNHNSYNAYPVGALAHKEPTATISRPSPSRQPVYETLHDVESGIGKKAANYNWAVTFYYMYYNKSTGC